MSEQDFDDYREGDFDDGYHYDGENWIENNPGPFLRDLIVEDTWEDGDPYEIDRIMLEEYLEKVAEYEAEQNKSEEARRLYVAPTCPEDLANFSFNELLGLSPCFLGLSAEHDDKCSDPNRQDDISELYLYQPYEDRCNYSWDDDRDDEGVIEQMHPLVYFHHNYCVDTKYCYYDIT